MKKKKVIELKKYCKACLGEWGCNYCGKRILSHSKVVRPFQLGEGKANLFFCTRTCYHAFKDEQSEDKT